MSDRVRARVEPVAGAGMDGGKVRGLGVLAAAAAVALGVYGAYGDPTSPDNQKSAVPFVAAMAVAVAAVVNHPGEFHKWSRAVPQDER